MILKLKKVSAVVLAGVLLISSMVLVGTPKALAAGEDQEISYVDELENGFVSETVIKVLPSLARDSAVKVDASSTIKDDAGAWVATVTLHVTFVYNGMTAGVSSVSYSKSLASGWSYTNHKITQSTLSTSSGADAKLTANLRKILYNVPVSISVHCSPDGTITRG